MATLKQILFIILLLAYTILFYQGNRSLREVLFFVEVLLTASLIIKYFIHFYRYSQLKEYFSVNLAIDDKYVVNYRGHCNASAREGESLHPLSFYWKDEVTFQEKRNQIIIEFNETKGKALIAIEKKLCDIEIILFFLIIIGCLSFYKL